MKKAAQIMIALTAAFILLILGYFFGRISSDGNLHVYTEKSNRSETIEYEETRPNGLININSASVEELQELPGIGESTAKAIIEYREKYGAFKTKKDIMKVKGIGEKTYEEFASMITV